VVRFRLVAALLALVIVIPGVATLAPQVAGASPPSVLCTAASGSSCPNPPTQPGGLDHFLCYQVVDTTTDYPAPKLQLTDQFGSYYPTQPEANFPTGNDRFCNPVAKTLGPLTYPPGNVNAHLFCIRSFKPTPNTLVTVSNQFGTGDLTVGAATRLCLPAWKYDLTSPSAPGSVAPGAWVGSAPGGLDHFMCYSVSYTDATSRQFPHPVVDLNDQFGAHPSVTVGDPIQLCAPVTKALPPFPGGLVFPANLIDGGPDTALDSEHLLCYSVSVDSPGRSLQIGSQFNAGYIGVTPPPTAPPPKSIATLSADSLCLPSFKALVPPPNTPEAPTVLLLPLVAVLAVVLAVVLSRRRGAAATA
jgi:hypothetical protein